MKRQTQEEQNEQKLRKAIQDALKSAADSVVSAATDFVIGNEHDQREQLENAVYTFVGVTAVLNVLEANTAMSPAQITFDSK